MTISEVDRAILDMLATLPNEQCATLDVALGMPSRRTSDDEPTLAWMMAAYNDDQPTRRKEHSPLCLFKS